jgi:hypothetical protein
MGQRALWQAALVAVQVLAVVVGCAAQPGPGSPTALDQAMLGETFTLRPGGVAVVRGEDLQVGFDRVLSDSRCPQGAQCIVKGEAVIRVWLSTPPQGRAEHELRTAPPPDAEAVYGEYRIRLVTLDPYPQVDRTISSSDYVATLLVTR